MREFYKEWTTGVSRAKALQNAMTSVSSTYPHPFHWAPFILVGKVLSGNSNRPDPFTAALL
jgi:CHAT domain-containing protein